MTAPRVTLEAIEAEIASEHYFTGFDGAAHTGEHSKWADDWEVPRSIDALNCLTFCVLVLRNGYTVTGQSSCASPANFDAAIGRKVAREKAIGQMWPLLGFRLADSLNQEDQSIETV